MAQRHRLGVAHSETRYEYEPDAHRNDVPFAQLVLEAEGFQALDQLLEPFDQTAEIFLFLDSLTRSRSGMPDPSAVIVFPAIIGWRVMSLKCEDAVRT
jgi:hypothetical protein